MLGSRKDYDWHLPVYNLFSPSLPAAFSCPNLLIFVVKYFIIYRGQLAPLVLTGQSYNVIIVTLRQPTLASLPSKGMIFGGSMARTAKKPGPDDDPRPWKFTCLMYIISIVLGVVGFKIAQGNGSLNLPSILFIAACVIVFCIGAAAQSLWRNRQLIQQDLKSHRGSVQR